jgi:hypothetical protein
MADEKDKIIADLSQRVARLENHDSQAEAAAVMQGSNMALQEAKFAALYSLALELAVHEGISEEQFLKHFQEARPLLSRSAPENSRRYKPELGWPN